MARRKQDVDPGEVIGARRKRQAKDLPLEPSKSLALGSPMYERESRIIQVRTLIAERLDDRQIIRWLVTVITPEMVVAAKAEGRTLVAKPWGVSEATARDYLRTAWRAGSDQDQAVVGRLRQRDMQTFEHILRLALGKGDLASALRAQEFIAKMNGSFQPSVALPATPEMEQEEAIEAIEHARDTLELARRLGVVSPSQAASAIDVAATEPPPADDDGDQDATPEEDAPAWGVAPTGNAN